MASNNSTDERVKVLVAALLAEEEKIDGRQENINDIEDAMVHWGDMLAREFGVQKLAARTKQVLADPPCPGCGHAGEPVGRELAT